MLKASAARPCEMVGGPADGAVGLVRDDVDTLHADELARLVFLEDRRRWHGLTRYIRQGPDRFFADTLQTTWNAMS